MDMERRVVGMEGGVQSMKGGVQSGRPTGSKWRRGAPGRRRCTRRGAGHPRPRRPGGASRPDGGTRGYACLARLAHRTRAGRTGTVCPPGALACAMSARLSLAMLFGLFAGSLGT